MQPPVNANIAPRCVVVSGVASGAGKTSLAVAVIEYLRRRTATAAVKITVTHGERGCPHGGKSCNVCSSLGGDHQIVTRRDVLEQPGTDTARFIAAGASPVLWGITRDVAIADLWSTLEPTLSGANCVVVESNTLALTLKPALNLMIVDPSVSRKLWKPSAEALISAADLVVINERGSEAQLEAIEREVKKIRGRGAVIKLLNPRNLGTNETAITLLGIVC